MKRISVSFRVAGVVSLMFGLHIGLIAQNYQTVNSSVTTAFIGNNDQQVESIRIDSSFVYGGDSVFYPFYNIQMIDYDCYLPFSYSWIGKKMIIKPDGYNCFINRENDTVKINTFAQLNENWIAYEISDTIIVAEVVKHDTLSFLGQTDSAKTISFTAYNQNMDSISLPINNKTIIISENFGLLETMNFSLFPSIVQGNQGVQTYDLLGMSSPEIGIVNLTWREIYDFDIGDEIHISGYDSHVEYPTTLHTEHKEKYIYLAKIVFSDSIIYTVDREEQIIGRRTAPWGNTIETHTYIHDTVAMVYKADSVLDKLSGEIINNTADVTGVPEYVDGNISDVRIEIGDTIKKTLIAHQKIKENYLGSNDGCWILYDYEMYFVVPHCLKGLGGPYYDYMFFEFAEERVLQYYKKGDKTWGTPLVITPLSISDMDNKNIVNIYPNPTDGKLHITYAETLHATSVQMFDVVGKQYSVGAKHILPNEEIEIDISHLAAGMYFLRIDGKVFKVVKQ
ncbi:MAG: T9SS type A sorting domain-containing protein [Lentimicrobiaceae bacterium]|nr:T9SS type A sorting domain-containing protein [Lentimicrobiaceae bacterium]